MPPTPTPPTLTPTLAPTLAPTADASYATASDATAAHIDSYADCSFDADDSYANVSYSTALHVDTQAHRRQKCILDTLQSWWTAVNYLTNRLSLK